MDKKYNMFEQTPAQLESFVKEGSRNDLVKKSVMRDMRKHFRDLFYSPGGYAVGDKIHYFKAI